jgi:hypothetical protein
MKQKEPATKGQKYLAILLALTMLLSVAVIFFTGGSKTNNNETSTPVSGENNDTLLSFSQIPGKHVHHQFNSIADGLNMSPAGVVTASYTDLQKTTGTPFEQVFGNVTMIKSLYGVDVTKLYGASYANRSSGFELHQVPEQRIYMPFGAVPYNNYSLLARTNNTYDIWNVVGSPVIFGHRQSVENVIDVLDGNATAETGYNSLLSQTNPQGSMYQQVIIKTNLTNIPADQEYIEFRKLDDGSYTQTSLYLNPISEFTTKIQALQANSTERGVTYNVTTSGNITKLMINSDFRSLLNETQLISK